VGLHIHSPPTRLHGIVRNYNFTQPVSPVSSQPRRHETSSESDELVILSAGADIGRDQAWTLETCIREVHGSNIWRTTGYPE
jgi:hypothetical protein